MSALDDAMRYLLEKTTEAGVKSAPLNPPESSSVFPFATAFERTGELARMMQGSAAVNATIYLDVHVSRQLLPAAMEQARALRDPVLKSVLADLTLGGAVENVSGVRWLFGHMQYGGVETLGYRFEISVSARLLC